MTAEWVKNGDLRRNARAYVFEGDVWVFLVITVVGQAFDVREWAEFCFVILVFVVVVEIIFRQVPGVFIRGFRLTLWQVFVHGYIVVTALGFLIFT